MKTTNRLNLTLMALLLLTGATACRNNTQPRSAEAGKPADKAANNAGQPEAGKTEPAKTEADKSSTGSLATPTAAYKTAYTARQKKDIAGLKRVFSKDILEFFTEVGKAENKTLDDALKEMVEQPMPPNSDVRNEKINGNHATLEYQNEKGKWVPIDFVKEGEDWKMTVPRAQSPAVQDKSEKDK